MQFTPSPWYPLLHVHENVPFVSVQNALLWQLWVPIAHMLGTAKTNWFQFNIAEWFGETQGPRSMITIEGAEEWWGKAERVWRQSSQKNFPDHALYFRYRCDQPPFLPRNATEDVQMYNRSISCLAKKYSKIVVNMKLLSNDDAVLGQCILFL